MYKIRDWKIAYKIAAMPALAAIGLLTVVWLTPRAVTGNQELMSQIETGFFPAVEMTRDLTERLDGIQRGLQDALASEDPELLVEPDALKDEFVARLQAAENNETLDPARLADLETRFQAYYTLARETTLGLMVEEPSEQVAISLRAMQRQYNTVNDDVQSWRTLGQENIVNAFTQARDNQSGSDAVVRNITTVALVSLGLLIALAVVLLRGITVPVSAAVRAPGAARRPERARQLACAPLPSSFPTFHRVVHQAHRQSRSRRRCRRSYRHSTGDHRRPPGSGPG